MNLDNGFDLLFAVVFYMRPKLGGIGPKYQDLWFPFALEKEKPYQISTLYIFNQEESIYVKW